MPAPPVSSPTRLAAALFLLAAAAGADVLVLEDGTRIESRGAWQEKGRQVVFTDADGKLCALRLADVDLDASRAATAAAALPAGASPKPAVDERPVVLALDADDLGLGTDPDPDLGEPRQVVLYAADWCGVCRKTEEYFAEIGVAYLRRDVDKDPSAQAACEQLSGGQRLIPVVDWGGEVIIGFKGARFAQLAKEDREAEAARELRAAARERETRAAEEQETRAAEGATWNEPAAAEDEPDGDAEPPLS
jgi:glutaredoxin